MQVQEIAAVAHQENTPPVQQQPTPPPRKADDDSYIALVDVNVHLPEICCWAAYC